jgi:hypothetical protein
MNKINELIGALIKKAEAVDGFYKVEISVLIRKDGGAKSDFIRTQSKWTPDSNANDTDEFDNSPKWMW